ncbi:MAG: hypothetical protein WC797_00360 [Candidatus Paceibacterota bacterium]|jgi:hypothetical protein
MAYGEKKIFVYFQRNEQTREVRLAVAKAASREEAARTVDNSGGFRNVEVLDIEPEALREHPEDAAAIEGMIKAMAQGRPSLLEAVLLESFKKGVAWQANEILERSSYMRLDAHFEGQITPTSDDSPEGEFSVN